MSQPVASLYRWTVDKYHRLVGAGILGADDRLELIQGEILQMAPINPPHASAVDTLAGFFIRQAPDHVVTRVQNPIVLSGDSEPQPDIVLVKFDPNRYKDRHPSIDDVLLIVEVSGSTVKDDRLIKIPLYARAGVPEVWLVDLIRKETIIHLDPQGELFKTINICPSGSISPSKVPSVVIDDVSVLF